MSNISLPDLLRTKRRAYRNLGIEGAAETERPVDKAASAFDGIYKVQRLIEQQVTDSASTLTLVSCSIRVLLQALGSAKYPRPSIRSFPPSTL